MEGDVQEKPERQASQIELDIATVNRAHGTEWADSSLEYYAAHKRVMEFAAKAAATS